MIKPDIGIITNIAESHIENFKNIKGIAKAKSEIINNIKINGTIILNHDDKFFNYLSKRAKLTNINIISFGMTKKANIHPIKIKKNGEITEIEIKVIDQIIKLKINNINIYNLFASLAVLKKLDLNIDNSSFFRIAWFP